MAVAGIGGKVSILWKLTLCMCAAAAAALLRCECENSLPLF